ncbi:MAG: hypothetical protein E5W55_29000, partial [Mesorhizobium sp.]
AGHFSPYRDGEKDAVTNDFAKHQRCRKGPADDQPLLPVTIRGEGAGRRMRGGAYRRYLLQIASRACCQDKKGGLLGPPSCVLSLRPA